MRKISYFILILILVLTVNGCSIKTKEVKNQVENKYLTVKANEDNSIILDTSNITSTATFVNYNDDGIIIQFILVRGTDNKVRIALNTCQVCNPSPKAYFIQEGEYLVCQNCGTKFHINKIGIEKGGCNPTPVEEKQEEDNKIIINKDYVDTFKSKFKNLKEKTKQKGVNYE